MADFILGRLKFHFKGDWVTGTAYIKDDVVRYGGNSFVAMANHTGSATFEADFVTVYVGEAEVLTPLFEIDTSELPSVLPDVGRVATPIPAANSASVFDVPEVPEVALPPNS